MPSSECRIVELKYGENDLFRCEIAEERLVSHFQPPREISAAEYHAEIASAMSGPLDFPPLSQSVIPGDKIAVAVEADFADPVPIIKEVWSQLASANIQPEDVTIIQAEFPGTGEDRKSTRLNSSHVVISYAVFCLKNKTPPPPPTILRHP